LQLGHREGEPWPWGCDRLSGLSRWSLLGHDVPLLVPIPLSPLSVTFSIPPAWLTYAQRNPYPVQPRSFTTHKPSCSHGGPGAGRCLPRWEKTDLDGSIPAVTLCSSSAPALGRQGGMVAGRAQHPMGLSWPTDMPMPKNFLSRVLLCKC